MWPTLIAKLAVKAEMKQPGSNKLKCRIFFTVQYLKYLFDYLVLKDQMERTYGKCGISIGIKFKGGDAERLARKHHAYDYNDNNDEEFFHIEADAMKLDTSLLASLLIVVFSLPFFLQKYDTIQDREWYEFSRQLAAFVVDGCAVKLIKWIGNQALWVIGVMFSGMLGTSWGDSTYMSLLLTCFDYYVYDQIKKVDPRLAKRFKEDDRPKDIYGDDLLLSYRNVYWKYVIGDVPRQNTTDLSIMSNYLLRAGGVSLKPQEMFVYTGRDAFFTKISQDGGDFVKAGPKFLQRRFVKFRVGSGEFISECAMPWRIASDYYMKSAYSFTDTTQELYWIVKWRSLQYDTCGTNPVAYNYLEHLQQELMHQYSYDSLEQFDEMVAHWLEKNIGSLDRDDDGVRRFKKLGLRADHYGKHMERKNIALLFKWDDEIQVHRARDTQNFYYEKDGKKSKISDNDNEIHVEAI
jgi:hypothetical protein